MGIKTYNIQNLSYIRNLGIPFDFLQPLQDILLHIMTNGHIISWCQNGNTGICKCIFTEPMDIDAGINALSPRSFSHQRFLSYHHITF